MDVILFSIKLNEICARLKTNGLKDDFEILEYFSGEDFWVSPKFCVAPQLDPLVRRVNQL